MRKTGKDSCELDIAYAYEDLVFSEHSLFIIQFDEEKSNTLYCWFNKDCIDADRHSIFKYLTTSSNLNGMKINYNGKFEMTQKEGEEQIEVIVECHTKINDRKYCNARQKHFL